MRDAAPRRVAQLVEGAHARLLHEVPGRGAHGARMLDVHEPRRHVDERLVRAVAVHEQDPVEAVPAERAADVEQVLDEHVPAQRDRAGEVHVVRRVAVDGGRKQERVPGTARVDALAGAARDRLGEAHVGVDRQVMTVILQRCARDHDHDVVALGKLPQLGPGVLFVAQAGHGATASSSPGYQHAASCDGPPTVISAESSEAQRSRARGQRGWKRHPRRDARCVGQLAREDLATPPRAGARRRRDRQERTRVRVLRGAEHLRGRALLDHAAEVHHRNPVAERPGEADVVGDEDQREPALLAQAVEQAQHLSADRHVEGADRLVAHESFRCERHRRRDRDALPLAAGELVGVAIPEALDRCQATLLHGLGGPADAVGAAADPVHRERLTHLVGRRHARVERLVRVLEHHLHAPSQRSQVLPLQGLAVCQYLAPGRALQSEQRASQRRLAAARFPDDAEHLPALPAQVDPVQCPHHPAATGVEVHVQPARLEQRVGGDAHAGASCGQGANRQRAWWPDRTSRRSTAV